MRTSIRCFCRQLGLDPVITPVSLDTYAEAVRRFRPSRAGLRKKHWGNILTDLRFALRWAGVAGVPGRNLTAPDSAWQTLLDRLDDRSSRDRISRFARWCTDRGTTPPQVDQATFDAFRAGLEAMPRRGRGRSAGDTAERLVRVWNRAAETVAGWPRVRLEGTARSRRWTLPLDAYPASLQAELEMYLTWTASRDPFDEAGPRRPLRPVTVEGLRYSMRAFLGALVAEGRPPESLTRLHDLVEMETVKAGLRHLLARSPRGGRAHQVARMLHSIARDRVGVDDEHLGQLRRLCAKLAAGMPRGLTDTNRERLRPFDDERHVSALLQLPSDLVRGARRDDDGRKAALQVQIALVIELLLMAPIRRRNLVGLRLDRHISWTRSGRAGVAHLVIPGEEVKSGEPLELELPAETSGLLRLYLDHYRPRLLAGPTPWLFPGRTPRAPKAAQVLAKQLSSTVRERIGLDVNLHLFRHIAAKLFLDARPGQYEVVRRLLGHKRIDTTVTFYAGAETAAAVRHYDHHILERRQRPALVRGLRSGGQ